MVHKFYRKYIISKPDLKFIKCFMVKRSRIFRLQKNEDRKLLLLSYAATRYYVFIDFSIVILKCSNRNTTTKQSIRTSSSLTISFSYLYSNFINEIVLMTGYLLMMLTNADDVKIFQQIHSNPFYK